MDHYGAAGDEPREDEPTERELEWYFRTAAGEKLGDFGLYPQDRHEGDDGDPRPEQERIYRGLV